MYDVHVVVHVVGGVVGDGLQLYSGGVEGHDGLAKLAVGVTCCQEDLANLRGRVHLVNLKDMT